MRIPERIYSKPTVIRTEKLSKEAAEIMAKAFNEATRFEQEATHDALTGLYNRKPFIESFESALARARRYREPLCVVMLDIDFFKRVNDTYGHPVGDRVLVEVAATLKRLLRGSDIVARYGGEEFILVLDLMPSDGSRPDQEKVLRNAVIPLERIRQAVEAVVINYGGTDIRVTISIGYTIFDPTAESKDSARLIKESDAALYRAKNSGRNRVCI